MGKFKMDVQKRFFVKTRELIEIFSNLSWHIFGFDSAKQQ